MSPPRRGASDDLLQRVADEVASMRKELSDLTTLTEKRLTAIEGKTEAIHALEKRLAVAEKEITELRDIRLRAEGVRWALVAVGTVIGTLLTGAGWLISTLIHR